MNPQGSEGAPKPPGNSEAAAAFGGSLPAIPGVDRPGLRIGSDQRSGMDEPASSPAPGDRRPGPAPSAAGFGIDALRCLADLLDLHGSPLEQPEKLKPLLAKLARLAGADTAGLVVGGAGGANRLAVAWGSIDTTGPASGWPRDAELVGATAERAIQSRATITSDEVEAGGLGTPFYEAGGAARIAPRFPTAAAFPLATTSEPLGALFVAFSAKTKIAPDVRLALEIAASQMAAAAESARLLAVAREQAVQAELLHAVTSRMRASLSPDSVAESSVALIARGMKASRCMVLLSDPGEGEPGATPGQLTLKAEFHDPHLRPLGDEPGLAERAKELAERCCEGEASDETADSEADTAHGPVVLLGMAIAFGGEPLGAVVLAKASGPADPAAPWGLAELRLLGRAADEMGRAVGHARLFESERASVERLRQLDQLKSEFVAMVSHELRTPLTSIKGFSSTLQDNYDAYEKTDHLRFLAIIQRQADRLGRLIADFLDVSLIQQGSLTIDLGTVDIGAVARQVAKELAGQAADEGRDIRVDAREVLVEADADKVSQMVTNLVSNALKYGKGLVQVEVRPARDGVTVAITDEGPGVAEEDAERIFDRFFQADIGSTRKASGVGLGLAIVKGLVEAHGGRAWYERGDPKGARFCFFLPLIVPDSIRGRVG